MFNTLANASTKLVPTIINYMSKPFKVSFISTSLKLAPANGIEKWLEKIQNECAETEKGRAEIQFERVKTEKWLGKMQNERAETEKGFAEIQFKREGAEKWLEGM